MILERSLKSLEAVMVVLFATLPVCSYAYLNILIRIHTNNS